MSSPEDSRPSTDETIPSEPTYSRREMLAGLIGIGVGGLGALGLANGIANERTANAYTNQGVEQIGANNQLARGDITTGQTTFNNEVPRIATSSGLLTAGVATLIGLAVRRRAIRAAENTTRGT